MTTTTDTPSPEQVRLMMFQRWQADPCAFAREALGLHLAKHQRRVLRRIARDQRVAVKSGHGMGKTFLAAVSAIWFLYTHPGSTQVILLATKLQQALDGVYAEVRALLAREPTDILKLVSPGGWGGRVMAERIVISDKWILKCQTADSPDAMQGPHADHLMCIWDEASGADPALAAAVQGWFTGGRLGRMVLLGNPIRADGGWFHSAFTRARSIWTTVTLSCLDSPAITGAEPDIPPEVLAMFPSAEWVENAKLEYGEGSNEWAARVLGDFPASAEDSVCDLGAVEAAQRLEWQPEHGKDWWPLVISCDVARFGSDETVIGLRAGNRIRISDIYKGKSLTETSGRLLALAAEVEREYGVAPAIVVDDTGVGGGVTDILDEDGRYDVYPFVAGERPVSDSERYPNRRSEAWFGFAQRLREGRVDLDGDEQLAADLLSPRWKMDAQGRRVVEPKADTKKRIKRSPDRADMVIQAFAPPRKRGATRFDPA